MASSPITGVTLGSVADMRQNIRRRSKLKGRQTDDQARAELRALIGHGPHQRDLLIEHLHRLNDEYRGLHERHLLALAAEMAIPMAEVYEVATFYHHFEVLKGDAAAPALTVRVCEGLSCELAGAPALLARALWLTRILSVAVLVNSFWLIRFVLHIHSQVRGKKGQKEF